MRIVQKVTSSPIRGLGPYVLTTPVCALAISLAAVASLPVQASAQEKTYSAEEVTRHFEEMKTRSLKPLGTTRALCIGTRDECSPDGNTQSATATGQTAGAPQSNENATKVVGEGFDLLVSFEFASARLSPTAKENLREFAKGISDPALAGAVFVIEGHTDGVGSLEYNQQLSEDRAKAVTEFLVSLGVDDERLKTVGYGETQPKVGDLNDPANRRVESRLILDQ